MSTSTTVLATGPGRFNLNRVSWGAIIAGLFLALVTYLFLGVLGTAVGAGSIDAMGDRNPLAGFGTGAGIWVGASTLIALAVGAFSLDIRRPTKAFFTACCAGR